MVVLDDESAGGRPLAKSVCCECKKRSAPFEWEMTSPFLAQSDLEGSVGTDLNDQADLLPAPLATPPYCAGGSGAGLGAVSAASLALGNGCLALVTAPLATPVGAAGTGTSMPYDEEHSDEGSTEARSLQRDDSQLHSPTALARWSAELDESRSIVCQREAKVASQYSSTS